MVLFVKYIVMFIYFICRYIVITCLHVKCITLNNYLYQEIQSSTVHTINNLLIFYYLIHTGYRIYQTSISDYKCYMVPT